MVTVPSVRVGIVAWNCADSLASCLAALPAALGQLDAEVVVVDNASSDGSAEVADAVSGVQVVRNPSNLGYAKGMNIALDGSPADVLVALNPDTLPPPGSLARLVGQLLDRPEVGLVLPRLVHDDGSVQHSVHRFPSVGLAAVANLVPPGLLPVAVRDRLWLAGSVRDDRSGPVDWGIGAVHVLRASAAPSPPYAERWFMYVEDLDLCRSLHDRGWQVWFAADEAVRHVGNVSGRQAFGGVVASRWWNETYDWFGRRHGVTRCRVYALCNALGTAGRGLVARVLGQRGRARVAARLSRQHLAVALQGPPAPLPPPAPST